MDEKLFPDGSPHPTGMGQTFPHGPIEEPPQQVSGPDDVVYATEEEEAVLEQFMHLAQGAIMQSLPTHVEMMNEPNKPVFENVGGLALKIAMMVKGSAESAGQQIEPEILQHGGAAIVDWLMEVGSNAGIFPFDQDSQEYEEASQMAIIHGHELAAKQIMAGPNADKYRDEAGTVFAQGLAQERERGEIGPEFFDAMQADLSAGVHQAIYGAR